MRTFLKEVLNETLVGGPTLVTTNMVFAGLRVLRRTHQSVSFAWDPQPVTNTPHEQAVLEVTNKNSKQTWTVNLPLSLLEEDTPGSNRYTLCCYPYWTYFSVRLHGRNRSGTGRWSPVLNANTLILPDVPENVTARNHSALEEHPGSIHVDWLPADGRGIPIWTYRLQISTDPTFLSSTLGARGSSLVFFLGGGG